MDKSGLVMGDSCSLLTVSRFCGAVRGIQLGVRGYTSNTAVRGSAHPQHDAIHLGRWRQTFGAASHGERQAS
jgi:hypothetical protein